MADFVYGSMRRDDSINPDSHRQFTQADCMKWLDTLENNSVNLWILDPPYNVLTGNLKNKNGAAIFHSRYTAQVSPSEEHIPCFLKPSVRLNSILPTRVLPSQ